MKIAVTSKTLSSRKDFIAWLKVYFDEVKTNNRDDLKNDSLIDFISGCQCIVLGTEPLNQSVIEKSKDLKMVFKYGVGIDNINFESCKEKGIEVVYKKGTNSSAVAEITVSYIIQLLRNQHLSFSSARKGVWNKQSGKEIVDAKIGILGFGNVGRTVFHKLRYMSNSQNIFFNDIDSSLVVRYRRNYMDLNTMLSTCDLITIHIDNQDLQNTHFIDGEKLKLIKDGGYLVNTSRGSIMNYLDLHMNLERLGGVALDVYPDEPHIPEFLQKSDKVILSCHICGSSESALKQGEDFIKESVINYDSRMISECVSKYLSEKK